MPTVFVTPEVLFETQGPHLEMLRKVGLNVRYPSRVGMTGEAETIEALQGAAATIAGGEPYTENVLASLPELRVISRWGVGIDRVDLDAVTRRGVVVAITPKSNHEAVAEHTMALLLALTRSLTRRNQEVRQGVWTKLPLLPLRGRTLGLIGMGRIGKSVALRAAQFRLRLMAYDSLPDIVFARTHGIELVDLDTLLKEADYVTLHVPLTLSTKGLINSKTLSQMKSGSLLVNTSRGDLVVEEDLVAALRSGHLAGAGLDVFSQEPPSRENPLLQLDNVLLTPHMAGVDTQSSIDMAVQAAQTIIDLYHGSWPEDSIVNPAVRSGWHW
jgi:D-3-phosphoglycerate dehydrogenase / 2-oxoglutarate reductase